MTENEAVKKLEYTKRNCGMPFQGNTWKPNTETIALDIAIEALEEIQQYRLIGTVEECREAVERQSEKKVGKFYKFYSAECPSCGHRIEAHTSNIFCNYCGQKLDWS